MTGKSIFLTIFLLTGLLAGQVHAQAVPQLINYQGRLTDATGAGLSGTKTIIFNIYDAPAGGNLIWGPQTFSNVPLVDGYFNVILGPIDTNGASLLEAFNEDNRYLSVQYNGQEISPRQQMLSAPYAIKSDQVHDDNRFPPVGAILPWHKSLDNTPTLPDGWAECNGQVLNDPESPYNGLMMPNLNSTSRFLMGSTTSGGAGGNAEHAHEYSGVTGCSVTGCEDGEAYNMSDPIRRKHNHEYSGVTENASSLPPYMAVVWVIRVK